MRSSKPDERHAGDAASEGRADSTNFWIDDLNLLADLGFGPAGQLMTEPKLFVDPRFLAALQVEFEEELGVEQTRVALFEIGVLHGLRDALRVGDLAQVGPGLPHVVASSPLPMRIDAIETGPLGLVLTGCWPDAHEAEARLAKLGRSQDPACMLSAGYTSGWFTGTFDVEMLAIETGCAASGAHDCSFRAREVDAWRRDDEGSVAARELLARIPIDRLRSLAVSNLAATGGPAPTSVARLLASPDADDPAVHVWGPVMVMPFTNVDIALETIATLGRDPSMRAVRAVVLDLGGAILDEGFGAAGLEHLIETLEAWGADVILTGISPFSADVVSDLEAAHLLIRKDLPEAIAYAFQLAEAHRHLL